MTYIELTPQNLEQHIKPFACSGDAPKGLQVNTGDGPWRGSIIGTSIDIIHNIGYRDFRYRIPDSEGIGNTLIFTPESHPDIQFKVIATIKGSPLSIAPETIAKLKEVLL